MVRSTSGWGYFQQGYDQMQDIDRLGTKLNLAISCPIHYPAFGKRLFECKCGKIFPVYVVKGSISDKLKELHDALS